jgi:hypothetical protein
LTINLTDAPVDDALEVVVVFTGIELQPGSAARRSSSICRPRNQSIC